MSIKFLNNGKTDTGLNLFLQENEPVTKKGIWLKSNKQFSDVVVRDNYISYESWDTVYPSSVYKGVAIAVGDYIYIFGSDTLKTAYKYDIKNNIFIKITDIPYMNGGVIRKSFSKKWYRYLYIMW